MRGAREAAGWRLLLSVCPLAVLACGCIRVSYVSAPRPARTTTIGPTQDGQLFELKEGQQLVVRLPDEKEGYKWAVIRPGRKGILRQLATAASEIPASATERRSIEFRFEAVRQGDVMVHLERRPEGGGPPVEDFEVTVRVSLY